ncbi:hypothetical protein ANME2D_01403 [Candidatus Methanoperedens nitroreducens]|uniref:Uncharacterized protein n=2 Tax=Candidatus Methanoperedens nitratireducens TaxID=1392998 RepID=A0A062V8C7_9EURY|nr:hypothetical protein ANME2D_01403 [Candidatus Methanoperedens nitroreducens]
MMAVYESTGKEPQINADERRFFPVTEFIELFVDRFFSVMEFDKTIHRKGRKERKAKRQKSFRPLRSGMKDFSSPSMNHSSWLTLRLNIFSTSERAVRALHGVSAFICVHLRFLNWVIFRTGFTGYVFNSVNPVILSNSKCQQNAPRLRAMVREGMN